MANYNATDVASLFNNLDINVDHSDIGDVIMDYFTSRGDTDVSEDSDSDDDVPLPQTMRGGLQEASTSAFAVVAK